jgi:hypothetical protein
MAKFIAFASLVVGGIIIADIVTHGSDFEAAAKGVSTIENPAIGGLLGVAP